MFVTIPACVQHEGYYQMTIEIADTCPKCGGPRGETFKQRSYDGSRCMMVDSWHNPCGHVDKYDAVREEYKASQAETAQQ